MESYDVVVVGGGPAGATFARIAERSKRVLLLDGNRLGKPCGGLLAPDAQKALARFDLTLPKEILVDPQIFSVRTIDLPTGAVRYYQRMYLNLDRMKFDHWLLSLLPENVTLSRRRCVDIRRQEGGFVLTLAGEGPREVFTRRLIGADGADSIVRRLLCPPLRTRKYVAIQQWFSVEGEEGTPFYSCIFDPETSDCCSWSIHKDKHFIFGGAFAPKDCRKQFERQKERLAAHGFPFGTLEKTEACLVLRPDSLRSFFCGEGEVFLLGEAAGFISPSSLEGVSSAINSAVALKDALGEKDPQAAYRRNTRKLRWKLYLKNLKCPFMYVPWLRRLVMASGLTAIGVWPEVEGDRR